MQQSRYTTGRENLAGSVKIKIKMTLSAFFWVAGLLAAGSEGPWMPYVNGLGGLVFLGACIWLGHLISGLENNGLRRDQVPRARAGKLRPLIQASPHKVRSGYPRGLGLV